MQLWQLTWHFVPCINVILTLWLRDIIERLRRDCIQHFVYRASALNSNFWRDFIFILDERNANVECEAKNLQISLFYRRGWLASKIKYVVIRIVLARSV